MKYFVARQPIYDSKLQVYGYELLFRTGYNNFFSHFDEDSASSDVITTSFMVVGLEELTSGCKAFVNFTKNLLIKDVATLFPNNLLAIELLESMPTDESVQKACRQLRHQGYQLVFDDFSIDNVNNPLLEFVDIIKVDFRMNSPEERQLIVQKRSMKDVKYLAEKVETQEEFKQALNWGYSFFQGYFLSKPAIHSGYVIPASKIAYLRILKEINKPDVDYYEVENIIKMDVSLSYKLLRFINSAFWGLNSKISSIRHAISMLGLRELRKWISLVALSNLAEDKPQELIQLSLVRAKMCEEIAVKLGHTKKSSEFFLMGLFSLIDVIIERPMADILANLPIVEDIKIALLGESNLYRMIFELILSYESGDWETFSTLTDELQLEEDDMPELFYSALKWVNQILQKKKSGLINA